MASIDVSAIILNYRNTDLTRRSLESFESAAASIGLHAELVVVDNSGAETGDALSSWQQDGRTILINRANRGFAAANNQGFKVSKGEFILLLNNDAFMTGSCLSAGVEFLKAHPDVGIWAPALKFEDGSPQRSVGNIPTLAHHFQEYLMPARFHVGGAEREKPRGQADVETVSGAVMLVPRAVFAKLGGFDEDFFFTVEDVDLCKRVLRAGYRVVYDSSVSVVHLGGASQAWKWVRDPYLHKARILFFKKHHGSLAGLVASLITALGLALRTIILKIRRPA